MKKVRIRSTGRWIPIQNTPVVRAGEPIRARIVSVNLRNDRRVVTKTTLPRLGKGHWRVTVKGGHGRFWNIDGSFQQRLTALQRAPSAAKADVTLRKNRRTKTKSDTVVLSRNIAGKQSGAIRVRP